MRTNPNDYAEWSPNRANYKALLMKMSDAAFEREKQGFEEVYWRESLDLKERFLKLSIINAEAQRRAQAAASEGVRMVSYNVSRSTSHVLGMH